MEGPLIFSPPPLKLLTETARSQHPVSREAADPRKVPDVNVHTRFVVIVCGGFGVKKLLGYGAE